MTDSVLDRISARMEESTAKRGDDDLLDDFTSFGWLRGVRDRAIMLELRLRTGNIISLGYMWLERAEFDPSEGILLQFGGKQIRIIGKNLNNEIKSGIKLYSGIVRHRVPWVAECDFAMQSRDASHETVIDEIRVNLR